MGTLLLLGGAYLVLGTTTGRALLGTMTGGMSPGGTGLPAALPAGTVRLPNGQYRLPTGQVVGTPTAGQLPVPGSSIIPIATAALTAVPPLIRFFQNLFNSTAGGTGSGGATGSPGAGGSASIPAPSEHASGGGEVDYVTGSITLSDGSVLDISGFSPGFLGTNLTLDTPDWTALAAPPVNVPDFTAAGELDLGADFEVPWLSLGDDPLPIDLWTGFGALRPELRVGYTPPPMRVPPELRAGSPLPSLRVPPWRRLSR